MKLYPIEPYADAPRGWAISVAAINLLAELSRVQARPTWLPARHLFLFRVGELQHSLLLLELPLRNPPRKQILFEATPNALARYVNRVVLRAGELSRTFLECNEEDLRNSANQAIALEDSIGDLLAAMGHDPSDALDVYHTETNG